MQTIVMLAFLVAAAVCDCASRKIPNLLTVPMALVGLAISFLTNRKILPSIWGLVGGLAIGLIIWLLGGFKAGDAKLIAATGAFAGVTPLLGILAWTFVIAAVVGTAYLLYKREFRLRMKRLWEHFKGVFLQRKLSTYSPPAEKGRGIPFAIFLLAGAISAYFAPIF